MSQLPSIPQKLYQVMDSLNAGKPIPAVDPAAFKAVWQLYEQHGLLDGTKAMGAGAWQGSGMREKLEKLSPQIDLDVAQVRVIMLATLRKEDRLKPWERGTELEERIFRIAATLVTTAQSYPDAFLKELETAL